ncbi:hypothetical protein [Maricaulis maris]|uniref:hypothetical protein n=1 Tax=Maricaulis maris TaxID=74318 RepID=UPI003B8B11AB
MDQEPAAIDDLMSISEIAKKLAEDNDPVERSTLSRYIKKHDLVHSRRGKVALCSYGRVKAHRSGNPNQAIMSGSAPAPAAANDQQPELPEPAQDVAEAEAPAADRSKVESFEAHARIKQIKATREEADLLKELGRLVERAQVEGGLAAAAAEMKRYGKGAAKEHSDRLLTELHLPADKAPEMRRGMRRLLDDVFRRFASEMGRAATRIGDDEDAEATERLERIIAFAESELAPLPDVLSHH